MTKQELPAPDPIKIPSRGKRMDFAPKKTLSPKSTSPKTSSSKPVTKPVVKTKTSSSVMSKTITIRRLTPPPMNKTEIISESGSPRHQEKRLRMDFVRHTTVVSTKPVAKDQPKVAPKQPTSSAPTKIIVASRPPISAPVKPVENSEKSQGTNKIPVRAHITKKPFLKKIIQIVEKPAETPVETPVETPIEKASPAEEQPVQDLARPDTVAKNAIDKDLEPLMKDEDLAIALAGFVDDDVDDHSPEENAEASSEFEEEIDALDELDEIDQEIEEALRDEAHDFVSEPKPLFKDEDESQPKKPDSPDANKYSLGGRSPFLTSVNVEKRPLSAYVPESNINSLKPAPTTPVKNSYREKVKNLLSDDSKEQSRQTMIISVPSKSERNSTLIIAIVLTVLLGALVGGLIYLLFFQ